MALYYITDEFPDFPAMDTEIIGKFWAQRWTRYWALARPWLLVIFAPIFGLLIFGRAVIWVVDGFRG